MDVAIFDRGRLPYILKAFRQIDQSKVDFDSTWLLEYNVDVINGQARVGGEADVYRQQCNEVCVCYMRSVWGVG